MRFSPRSNDLILLALCWLFFTGETAPENRRQRTSSNDEEKVEPSPTSEIPRFGINSPFSDEYQIPFAEDGKRIWARTALWEESPALEVEEWIGDEPTFEGKHLLIEFWATWCSQCRRAIPLLNSLHEKFQDELVIIAVSDEAAKKVRPVKESLIKYYCATDTKARMKDSLGVFGIPHAIIVEPGGFVVWEGFPLQPGFELTESIVERILSVSR